MTLFAEAPHQTPVEVPVPDLMDQVVDLGALIRRGIPPVTYLETPTLGERTFYQRRMLHLVTGHRKHGKSIVAATAVLDHVSDARPVLYLDFENGAELMAERYAAMCADPDALTAWLHYVPLPKGITLDNFYDQLTKYSDRYPDSLLVVDSWRGLLAKLGTSIANFNQNDTGHVERVFEPLTTFVKTEGPAAIVLDHPSRGTTRSSEYSAGNSVAKEQIADVIYWVEKLDPYSEETRGSVLLRVKQDRRGKLIDRDRHYRVGGQGADGHLRLVSARWYQVGVAGRIAREILSWLHDHTGSESNAATQSAIEGAVEGKADLIRNVLKTLATEGHVRVVAKGHDRYYLEPDDPTDLEPPEIEEPAI